MVERGHVGVAAGVAEGAQVPNVAEGSGLERPAESGGARSAELQAQAPELGDHLLFGVEVDDHGPVDMAEGQPDHRILRGGLRDGAVLVHGAGDRAVGECPAAAAARVPARLVRIVGVAEVGDGVVDGGYVGEEAPGEVQSRAVQISHGYPPDSVSTRAG